MKVEYKDVTIDVVSTPLSVKVFRVGSRTIYKDKDTEQQYVKVNNKWWKFPQEISY